mmetsp:Transcript_14888/g.20800  ORF Transcript_14888/g.20800 Transcript_14888/m.20800 type:complete len:81 (+) Transcript_14888:494-736(+)
MRERARSTQAGNCNLSSTKQYNAHVLDFRVLLVLVFWLLCILVLYLWVLSIWLVFCTFSGFRDINICAVFNQLNNIPAAL